MSTAAGQYLGFSLQLSRLLERLLQCHKSDAVSLEAVSNIAVHSVSGEIHEELKSVTSGYNPGSNTSLALWKTLSNWADDFSAQVPDSSTKLVLHATSGKMGELAKMFTAASTVESAAVAIETARQMLWGPAPAYPKRATIAETIAPYVTNFFTAKPEIQQGIVMSFEFSVAQGKSLDQIRAALVEKLIPEEILDEVLQHALGWLKAKTDSLLEQRKTALILYDDFHLELLRFVRMLDRRQMLQSFAATPKEELVHEHLKTRTYVRQLELIQIPDEDRLVAVTDYLRAEADRIIWAQKGWIHDGSLREYELGLTRAWKNYRMKVSVSTLNDEVSRGQSLYAECGNHAAKLDGSDLPSHFTPGSFHRLSEDQTIGWHSDYKSLLAGGK